MVRMTGALLAIAIGAAPQAVWGQNQMNRCIDSCWSSCSGYPLGSSGKQACVDRCIKYTCQKQNVDPWGAIAFSKKEKISGWAYEQVDKATAENMALRYCVKEGGSQCSIVTSFSRTCASLAVADGEIIGWGTSGTRQAAQQQALTQCGEHGGKNCVVKAWTCSAPNSSSGNSPDTGPRPTPSPPKATSWGAMAYSTRDMGAGWSQGKDDRASAEREAMKACMNRGKECVVRSAFNKQCGALAADGAVTGTGTSSDQRQALQKAMDECKKAGGSKCAPHIAFCSF